MKNKVNLQGSSSIDDDIKLSKLQNIEIIRSKSFRLTGQRNKTSFIHNIKKAPTRQGFKMNK